ncbi:unnamed protein product [Paramecium octaurelia]|uniref:Protein kinase domain-containing protein n=1 Tax=Paramecium octaurelia TaxID=43137 RepID=A0A8S1SSG7_PAROT|nr:unnamed protein product [Paramecium octaurelia]
MKRFLKLNLDISKKITYEQTHRKCFFQRDYVRMEWTRQKLPKSQLEFDIVQKVIMKNKKNVKKTYLIMMHQNIMMRQKKDGSLCWIDYENSILDSINDPQFGDGIRLTKCFDEIEIYGELDKMLPYFKKYTIQLEFTQQYHFLKKINSCDKTEVFRIRSKTDRNDYQCKIFYKKALNLTMEKQIEKELYILRRINDEYIQKYFETFENQEQIIIVEELIIGGNFDSYLQKWPLLSEEKASKFFFKLFKSLAYLHSKGIMHRDLKPENIGLRLNGNLENPCICFFGLADVVSLDNDSDQEEETPKYLFQRCGTPGFVAPEILKNQQYDCKVDIYSLGIMMYYSLTGKKPFDSDDYQQLIEQNEEGLVDISILKLSKEGLMLIESILKPDPDERITAQAALNHIWFKTEKLSKLMEFKAHKNIKKFQFKSPQHRKSMQNSPKLLPIVLNKQSVDQSYGSPLQHQFSNAYRNSINSHNHSIFRITTLNGSFSPKEVQSFSQSLNPNTLLVRPSGISPSFFAKTSRPSQSISVLMPNIFPKQLEQK